MFDQAEIASRRSRLSLTKRDLLAKILREADETKTETTIRKRDPVKPVALSFHQQRLLSLALMAPEDGTYNISRKVTLSGSLNVAALLDALNQLIERHESLRTCFRIVDGEWQQWIEPSTESPVITIDLSERSEAEQETEITRLAGDHARQPFNFAEAPLLRASLLRLNQTEHVLLLTVNHLVADGWSIDLFFRELQSLYEAFSAREPSPLSELQIQYADFANWQRETLAHGSLDQQRDYWREQLADVPPALELLTDKPRRTDGASDGARQPFWIPPHEAQQLREFAQSHGLSLFMLLVSALATLLYRYTGQRDVCIGVPAAQRSPKELEDLIGFLVNTIVLRTQFEAGWTVRQLLESTRDVSFSAFSNQDLPFDEVVELSQTKREPGRTPLFQVMFALHAAWFDSWTMAGVECNAEVVYNDTAKFELGLELTEAAGGLKGFFEYRTDLFDEQTIAAMAHHFQVLLKAITSDIDRPVATLPLMEAEERRQVLRQAVAEQTDYLRDRCIHELFKAQVSKTPDAIAVSFAEHRLTYQQLDERANQLARHLQRRGLHVGMLVPLLVDQKVEMAVGILGILKAGGAYLPVDPTLPPERLAFLFADSSASLVVTQAQFAEKLREFDVEQVCLDADWAGIERESTARLNLEIDPQSLAYVIYTSGSTGRPKGVLIPHRGVVNHGLEFAELQALAPGDRVLQFATLSFDTAVEELFSTWFSGATVVTKGNQAPAPADFMRLLRQEQITIVNLPTAYWHLWVDVLARSGERLPSQVRVVVIGGEKALSERLESWWKSAGGDVHLINGYGPTETTVTATVIAPSLDSWSARGSSVPIGRPIKNVEAYVLDTHLEPVPIGVAGELYLGGAGLAHGYLGRPELTAEKFVPHPFAGRPGQRLYATGDLVRYLPDSTIEYLRRKDQQVKVRGYRIELGEIESVLGTHEAVRDVAVVTQEHAPGEHRLIAYFVANGAPVSAPELREYASEKLPSYMVPSAFVGLDALPLTATKKVDRQALAAREGQRQDEAQPRREGSDKQVLDLPRTPIERKLLELWESTLSIQGLGIYDDFFALGGHSLLAMKLIALVQEAFQTELPPFRELFEQPTVAAFARTIESALKEQAGEVVETSIKPFARNGNNGELPLSFNQEARLFRDWWDMIRKMQASPFQMQIALRLSGPLQVPQLEQAFTEVVTRHECLRSTFHPPRGLLAHKFLHPLIDKLLSLPATKKRLRKVSKNNVWQSSFFKHTVKPPEPFKLRTMDLRGLSTDVQEAEVRRLASEEVSRRVDYSRDSVISALLLQLSDEQHVLIVIVSHLVADGWSVRVLLDDVSKSYYALCNNAPSPLPELPFQYADFAYWQRARLQGKVKDELVSYWEKRFKNFPLTPHTEFPFAKPRTSAPTYTSSTRTITLSAELSAALKEMTRTHKVTLYMLLLTGLITLLARYSAKHLVNLFVIFANRHRLETQSVIGWLSNVHAFNTDLSNLPTFADLLDHVRTTLIEDYAHQEIPYSLLFGELLQRNSNYKVPKRLWEGLYVIFDLRVDEEKAFHVPGLNVSSLEIPTRFADDLSIWAMESSGVLKIRASYAGDRFDDSRIAEILNDYEQLLLEVSRQPETSLPALTRLDQTV